MFIFLSVTWQLHFLLEIDNVIFTVYCNADKLVNFTILAHDVISIVKTN
jgi:hypothetical protein